MYKNVNGELGKIIQKYRDPERGLNASDYKTLKILLFQAEKEKKFKTSLELKKIIEELEKSDVLHKYSYSNYLYVRGKLPILPLVLANENVIKTRFYKENGIKLYCETNDNLEVLGVYRNKIMIFTDEAKTKINNIHYIQQTENIGYDEAFELLCAIYNCNIPNTYIDKEKVKKYKDIITSENYKELLEKSKLRAQLNNYYVDKNIEYYEKMFRIINNISENIEDSNFKYIEPNKVLVKK